MAITAGEYRGVRIAKGIGRTVNEDAPHSVANRGMSLCAFGLPLATPVLYNIS